MKVICKNCGKAFNLSKNDETKIEELSTPNTYPVKINSFLCKNCFNKNYQVGSIIRKSREDLDLDVDKE